MHHRRLLPVLSALAACCALAAPAQALTLLPADSGNVTEQISAVSIIPSTLTHNPIDTNVSAAALSVKGGTITTRGYALFAIPDSLGEATAVTLKVDVVPLGIGPVGFTLMSVEHTFADFQVAYSGDPTAPGEALLQDLGDGATYHPYFSLMADSSIIGGTFALSPAAVAALNAARGGYFGIGFSGGGSLARIEFMNPSLLVTAVPEPATWLLAAGGLLLVGARARRA